MPMVWIQRENERATVAGTSSTLVNTGKATAPPPWGVDPATMLPKIIVRLATHRSSTRPQWPLRVTKAAQITATATLMARA